MIITHFVADDHYSYTSVWRHLRWNPSPGHYEGRLDDQDICWYRTVGGRTR
jgi:hypothetical protein